MLELRARAQRLMPATRASPATILRDTCGLQAQLLTAAALGMRARSPGLRLYEVDRALSEERSIVRSWLMRGTLHLVAAEDLRWLLAVLGPVFAGGNQRRHAQLGLTADIKARGVEAIRQILSRSGPLTRFEIVDHLRRHGLILDPGTQAPIHLMAFAAQKGVLCLAADRASAEPTYALLDDWIDPSVSREPGDPLAELALRYFAAFGPATLEDLVTWSGLPAARARAALTSAQPALTEVRIGGRPAYLPKARGRSQPAPEPRPIVRLLPAFDTYLLGYRSRDLAVPRALQKRVQRGGGWLHPAAVVNGRAVAAWSLKKSGKTGQLQVEAIEPLSAAVRKGIKTEIDDIGRFLDLELTPVYR
ncbi:MAG TPA: winged helix DNA-binding domain-containing protein [Candidatus Dormibacteraeota bacterium]|nr:winged helix DNA-binding domain-containing protein [Candidatus Dormibacteraeota bacterium]